nr:immunoglobulin light chain junction region [Macaca mulatta]
CQQDYSDPTTF